MKLCAVAISGLSGNSTWMEIASVNAKFLQGRSSEFGVRTIAVFGIQARFRSSNNITSRSLWKEASTVQSLLVSFGDLLASQLVKPHLVKVPVF